MSFESYRYDLGIGDSPSLETLGIDLDYCGSMVLDTLFWSKN